MTAPETVADANTVELAPGVEVTRLASGERLQGQYVQMAPEGRVDAHAHPHEQLTFVLSGRLTLILEKDRYELEATDSLLIPGDVEHAAEADAEAGATAFDVFSPPRGELSNLD